MANSLRKISHLLMIAALAIPTLVRAEAPACSVLFTQDNALLDSLPERIRVDLESARVKLLLSNANPERQVFYEQLDFAFAQPGTSADIQIGSFHAKSLFRKTSSGKLQLVVSGVSGPSAAGFDFLKYIAAQTEWLAIQRGKGAVREIEIIGQGIQGDRLEKLFASLGFQPAAARKINCYEATAIGVFLGYSAGMTYFKIQEALSKNGSVYDQQRRYRASTAVGAVGGAVLGAARFCLNQSKGSYSLMLLPGEPHALNFNPVLDEEFFKEGDVWNLKVARAGIFFM